MAERPSAFNIRRLLLVPVCWTETISSRRGIAMKAEAVASRREGGRFNVPGLGNILELPFDLDLIRGETQPASIDVPADAAGFLACRDNRTDESGVRRTAIVGQLALAEAVFDDVWERVRLGPEFRSSIAITVGPVDTDGVEGFTWDRAKNEALYVLDVELAFTRDVQQLDH